MPKRYLKPGIVQIFLEYLMLSIMLVFLFAVAIPFMMTWYVNMHIAGQTVLSVSGINNTLNSMSNDSVVPYIKGVFITAQQSNADSIDILGFFFRYGGIIIVIVITFSLFMCSRKLVETQQIVWLYLHHTESGRTRWQERKPTILCGRRGSWLYLSDFSSSPLSAFLTIGKVLFEYTASIMRLPLR